MTELRSRFRNFIQESQVGSSQVAAVTEQMKFCLEKLEKGADITHESTQLMNSISAEFSSRIFLLLEMLCFSSLKYFSGFLKYKEIYQIIK